MKKYFLIIQIVLASTILSICHLSIVAAEPINSILTGWRIIKDLSVDLNIYNECKRVVSPLGMDVFIPTKNQQEWNSFKL